MSNVARLPGRHATESAAQEPRSEVPGAESAGTGTTVQALKHDARGAWGESFHVALDASGVSMRSVAEALECDPKIVQRMVRGQVALRPEAVAAAGVRAEIAFHESRLAQLRAEQRERAHTDMVTHTLGIGALVGQLQAWLQKAQADHHIESAEAQDGQRILRQLLERGRSADAALDVLADQGED